MLLAVSFGTILVLSQLSATLRPSQNGTQVGRSVDLHQGRIGGGRTNVPIVGYTFVLECNDDFTSLFKHLVIHFPHTL